MDSGDSSDNRYFNLNPNTMYHKNSLYYICLLVAFLIMASIANGQITLPKKPSTIISDKMLKNGTTTYCDTCKYILLSISSSTSGKSPYLFAPKAFPDWTFNTEATETVARLSRKDSNGQQTGWFDKRYIKITSDSTFVILPKSK